MLIDAHVHLDRYEDSLDRALQEIARHGIFTISNSMDLPSYQRNLEIAEARDLVLAIFGVHPWNAPEYVDRLGELDEITRQSPILGEIGLDFHFVDDSSRYPAQQRVFEYFLSAAREQRKIVNVHTKGAEREVLHRLREYDIERAIIHWYSGPLELFHDFLDFGVCFTVGMEVLHSDHIKTIARELPSERILTETDNPGGLKWLTGTSGMPHHLRDVVRTLAEVRRTSSEAIVQTVSSNFERLIRDDPWLVGVHERLFEKGQNNTF